jgi:predicted PurR-regulated permease PerM
MARAAIVVFVVAILLAYLLAPLVALVGRLVPGRTPRPVSLAVVYAIGALLLVLALTVVGSRIAAEAVELAARLPQLMADRDALLAQSLPELLLPYRAQIGAALDAQFHSGADALIPTLRQIGAGLLSRLHFVLYIVLVPILSFLFQLDNTNTRSSILDLFESPARRALAAAIVDDVHLLLGRYMRAVFLLAVAAFTAYALFFLSAGVPYALLLAGAAGVLEFIPVAGPLAGMIVCTTVAAFSGYPHLEWMIVFFLAYRLFQDYVVQPYVFGKGVQMHPLLVLFGVLAGEQVAGVTGMFLSVPLMAVLRIVYRQSISQLEAK